MNSQQVDRLTMRSGAHVRVATVPFNECPQRHVVVFQGERGMMGSSYSPLPCYSAPKNLVLVLHSDAGATWTRFSGSAVRSRTPEAFTDGKIKFLNRQKSASISVVKKRKVTAELDE